MEWTAGVTFGSMRGLLLLFSLVLWVVVLMVAVEEDVSVAFVVLE